MAQVRVLAGVGYGLVTLVLLSNADLASELGRTAVHFFSRPRGLFRDDGSGGGRDGSSSLDALNAKLDRLAAARGGEVVHHYAGREVRAAGWITTAVGGTVALMVVVHVSGLLDLSGFMYVTQSKFRSATDALKEKVQAVSDALAKVRRELLDKVGAVDANLTATRAELKQDIQLSTQAIQVDVAGVSERVRDVGELVTSLEEKLNRIDGGVGDLRSAVERANRGIMLLCHVVADSFKFGAGNRNPQQSGDGATLNVFRELQIFTKTSPAVLGHTEVLKQLTSDTSENGPVMRIISHAAIHSDKQQLQQQQQTADMGGGGSGGLTRQISANIKDLFAAATSAV